MNALKIPFALLLIFSAGLSAGVFAQSGGNIKGSVNLKSQDMGLHNASVRIVQLNRVADTREDGSYEFTNVPPGTYDVVATMPSMNSVSQQVTVAAGATATTSFDLEITGIRSEVTVTATGREELTLEAIQTVTSLDALDLARTPSTSLGEALNNQPGVAKRSMGPGSARPVIRGFDGDRVLVLQDGTPTGGLGSQSGDHPEPVNTSTAERLEVLKGPATLLYGSNAIGGVVNAVTTETNIHDHPHEGMQGFLSGFGGSNNNTAGGSVSFDYGAEGLRLFGNAGALRAGSYRTREGEVPNTQTRMANGQFGIGLDRGNNFFFSASGGYDDGRSGILGEDAEIDYRRYNARFNGGVRRLDGAVQAIRTTLGYTDWSHSEIEDDAVATILNNKQFTWRSIFEQQQRGQWTGSFGLSGVFRNFDSIGEEALAPPTNQKGIAAFALQEVSVDRLKFQFGGRLDHMRYGPEAGSARQFTGLSGGAGVHVSLWENGAFVANFTSSHRSPALEELYNNGPHPGNQAFEIGDETLSRERSNGLDLSLRHQAPRVHSELNFFYYDILDFVYLAPTGAVQDDLNEFNYSQTNARFIGSEALLELGLHENLWLKFGLDSVNAKIKDTGQPLPRIPPVRGHAGLEVRWRGLSIVPEVQMANAQDNLFTFETRTPGYSVFNLKGSYSIVSRHAIHMLSGNFFNMGDRVYRNHVSFLKDAGPEIGRGISFSYSMRFF